MKIIKKMFSTPDAKDCNLTTTSVWGILALERMDRFEFYDTVYWSKTYTELKIIRYYIQL